jgi:hypothetical protein
MEWARHAACMMEKSNAYGTVVGKPEKKRPLSGTDWIDLARD